MLIAVIATSAFSISAGDGSEGETTATAAVSSPRRASAPARCPDARVGLAFYRGRYSSHRAIRGLETEYPAGRKPRNCADASYLAELWTSRALEERLATERWVEEHTLDDFAVRPGNRAWEKAVREVQKVFPGTEGILLSCSDSEGGRGRWVGFGGVSYYDGYRGVGGWLQFLPGTFYRHFGAALAVARENDFRVPSSYASWLSAGGQALAGAWGLTYSRGEWAGAGCR